MRGTGPPAAVIILQERGDCSQTLDPELGDERPILISRTSSPRVKCCRNGVASVIPFESD